VKKITAVLVIKNRPEKIARNCIESLLSQTHPCDVIIVDFGSSEENLKWERSLVNKSVALIEVTRDTTTFNKSRALNIGFKAAHTKYVLSTDIDCIFASNFIEETVKALETPKTVVLCQKVDLDKDGKEGKLHEPSASGSCIAIDKAWINKVHGYDEFYTFWGREDTDLVDRAIQDGYIVKWITGKTTMWHQWHPPAAMHTLEKNKWYYEIPNKPLIRNGERWGEI